MGFPRPTPSRGVLAPVAAAALALALAGCSNPPTPRHPSAPPSSTKTATFSGAESGTISMNLCAASGDDSVFVVVRGTRTRLPGVVSATNLDFDGEDSIYSIDKTGPLPRFSTDGKSVSLDGVVLRSVIDPSRAVTFAGSIACP
ncbi:MAG: hypothetical protein WDM88_01595 [Galbitalea sp.]